MVYTDEDLDAWFWDFLGLGPSARYKKRYDSLSPTQQKAFRARKSRRVYSKEDRPALSKKRFVHGRVYEGVGMYMNRRREKGLGTYDNNKFVVAQWDPKHGKNKFSEIFERNRAELDDMAGIQAKLPKEGRDAKGRFSKR